MIRNKEAERLAKQKEIWANEDSLTKEEELVSWKKTIDVLEKAHKDFGFKKDVHSLVWKCKEGYKEEDKVACKKEVIRILKMCKKEDLLINNPAVANLIYVNRLNKRKETTTKERLDISKTVLVSSKGKETKDMDKEWSKEMVERWDKFLKNIEDKDYIERYREWFKAVKEKRVTTKTIDAKGLAKKEYDKWTEDEDKKMCWLETVRILNVCNQKELTYSNPYVVQELYIDRLIRNGFVEKVKEEKEIVSAIEQETNDEATTDTRDNDKTNLNKDKEAADKTAADIITIREQKRKDGIDALKEYLQAGIGLIGAYASGAAIAKDDEYDKEFTCDTKIIELLWEGKDERAKGQQIRRYYFKPEVAGLICLDIDCKDGKDGLAEFYYFCRLQGKPKECLPKILQDIPNNFPCFVKTPNSGYHLYFKAPKDFKTKCVCLPHAPSVEVKTKQLTAAGSFKDGKPYVLYGNISLAPILPDFIKTVISSAETMRKNSSDIEILLQKQKNKQHIKSLQQKKDWGKSSWDKIIEWTQKDKPSEISKGKNNRAFHLALHAKTHKYTSDETLYELLNDADVNTLPEREIRDVLKSAYKK